MRKALGSPLQFHMNQGCDLNTRETGESEVQGHPRLYIDLRIAWAICSPVSKIRKTGSDL